jgi:hypothetical protein
MLWTDLGEDFLIMAALLTGGCACGAVRYECSGEPIFSGNCYCRDCQRSSGTAMASVLGVPKAAVKVLKGEARYFEVTADSGKKISRGFCSTCGTPLFSLLAAMPDLMGIKASSLDDPSQFRPGMSLYTSSAPAWAPFVENLPKFPKMPG